MFLLKLIHMKYPPCISLICSFISCRYISFRIILLFSYLFSIPCYFRVFQVPWWYLLSSFLLLSLIPFMVRRKYGNRSDHHEAVIMIKEAPHGSMSYFYGWHFWRILSLAAIGMIQGLKFSSMVFPGNTLPGQEHTTKNAPKAITAFDAFQKKLIDY